MSEIKEIKMAQIRMNPHQPRTFFDDEAIENLAISIRENGLVQPITLRAQDDGYELIAGERRFRACQYLGYESIPAYIISTSDSSSMYMALIENIQREDLSAIEEAKAYLRIMQLNNMTQKELSNKIGKSQPSVANKIRLLNLDINVQNAIEAKMVSERHARALLSVDKEKQNQILSKVLKEDLTVAQTERLVKADKKVKTSVKGYSRDILIGVNTIKRACEMVEKSGLKVALKETEDSGTVTIEVKISK